MSDRRSTSPERGPKLGGFNDQNRAATGCRTALLDVWLIIGSLGMALLGVVTLSLIASAMRKDPERYENVSAIVGWTIDHRGWFTALSVAPTLLGITALQRRTGRRTAWILRTIGTLMLGVMICLIVFAFLALVMPLYQYQPL